MVGGVAEAGMLVLLLLGFVGHGQALAREFRSAQRADALEHAAERLVGIEREPFGAIVVRHAFGPGCGHGLQIVHEQRGGKAQVFAAARGVPGLVGEIPPRTVAWSVGAEVLTPEQEFERMKAGADVLFAFAFVERDDELARDAGEFPDVVDDAGVRIASDVIDVMFVDGPGVDSSFDRVDGSVVKAIGLRLKIRHARGDPGAAGGLLRGGGRRGQQRLDFPLKLPCGGQGIFVGGGGYRRVLTHHRPLQVSRRSGLAGLD